MPLSGVRSPVGRAHHHLFLQSSKTRASQEPARSRPSPSFLVQERAHCSAPSLSSLSAHPKCKTMAQNTPSSVLCDSTTALLQAVQRQSRRLLRHPCESCLFPASKHYCLTRAQAKPECRLKTAPLSLATDLHWHFVLRGAWWCALCSPLGSPGAL